MASESGGLSAKLQIIPYKQNETIVFGLKNSELSKLHKTINAKRDALQELLNHNLVGKLLAIDIKPSSDTESDSDSSESDSENDFQQYGHIVLNIQVCSPGELQRLKSLIDKEPNCLSEWLTTVNKAIKKSTFFRIHFEQEYFKSLMKAIKKFVKSPHPESLQANVSQIIQLDEANQCTAEFSESSNDPCTVSSLVAMPSLPDDAAVASELKAIPVSTVTMNLSFEQSSAIRFSDSSGNIPREPNSLECSIMDPSARPTATHAKSEIETEGKLASQDTMFQIDQSISMPVKTKAKTAVLHAAAAAMKPCDLSDADRLAQNVKGIPSVIDTKESLLEPLMLPTFLSESELQKLATCDQEKYILKEFRLCLPDIYDYLYCQHFNNVGNRFRKEVTEIALGHVFGAMPDLYISLILKNEKLNKIHYTEDRIKANGLNYYCLPPFRVFIRTEFFEHLSYNFSISTSNDFINLRDCRDFMVKVSRLPFLENLLSISLHDLLIDSKNDLSTEKKFRKISELHFREVHSDSQIQFAIFGYHSALRVVPKVFTEKVSRSYVRLIYGLCCKTSKETQLCDSLDAIYIRTFGLVFKPLFKDLDPAIKQRVSSGVISAFSYLTTCNQVKLFYEVSNLGKAVLGLLFVRIQSMLRQLGQDLPLEHSVANIIMGYLCDNWTLAQPDSLLKALDHPECIDTILAISCAAKSHESMFLEVLEKLRCPQRMGTSYVSTVSDCLLKKTNLTVHLLMKFCCFARKYEFDLKLCEPLLMSYVESGDRERKSSSLLESARKWPELDSSVSELFQDILKNEAVKGAYHDLQTAKGMTLNEIFDKAKLVLSASDCESAPYMNPIKSVQEAILRSLKQYASNGELAHLAAFSELTAIPRLLDDGFGIQLCKEILNGQSRFRTAFVKNFHAGCIYSHLKSRPTCSHKELPAVLRLYFEVCFEEGIAAPQDLIEPMLSDCSNLKDEFFSACLEAYESLLTSKALDLNSLQKSLSLNNPDLISIAFKACATLLREKESNEIKEFFLKEDFFTKTALNSDTVYVMQETFRFAFASAPEVEQQMLILLQSPHIWKWIESASDQICTEFVEIVRRCLSNLLQFLKKLERLSVSRAEFETFLFFLTDNQLEKRYDNIDTFVKILFTDVKIQSFYSIIEDARERIKLWDSQKHAVEEILRFFDDVKKAFKIDLTDFDNVRQIFQTISKEDCEICDMLTSAIFKKIGIDAKLVADTLNPNELLQSAIFKVFISKSVKNFHSLDSETSCSQFWNAVVQKACQEYKQFISQAADSVGILLCQIEDVTQHINRQEITEEDEVRLTKALNLKQKGVKNILKVLLRNECSKNYEALIWLFREYDRNFYKCSVDNESFESHNFSESICSDRSSDSKVKCRSHFDSDLIIKLQAFLDLRSESLLMSDYLKFYDEIEHLLDAVTGNMWLVMRHLFDCRDGIVKFLMEQVDSDFQHLMDVSYDAGQEVSLSTVSSLILLQGALKPLLSKKQETSVLKQLFDCIGESISFFERHISSRLRSEDTTAKNLVERLQECEKNMNAIKELHASIGSRGETSKNFALKFVSSNPHEITVIIRVNVSAKNSDIRVSSSSLNCEEFDRDTESSDSRRLDDTKENMWIVIENRQVSLKEMIDHRSRILMTISSTHVESSEARCDKDKLLGFIAYVDKLENVYMLYQSLREVGHPAYFVISERQGSSEIEKIVEHLQSDLDKWNAFLKQLRKKFRFANYLSGENLMFMVIFFSQPRMEKYAEILSSSLTDQNIRNILAFLNIDLELSSTNPKNSKEVSNESVTDWEMCTEKMFAYVEKNSREVSRRKSNFSLGTNSLYAVQKGNLFLTLINPADKEVIGIFLNVWSNSQSELPLSSEVVFCSQETTSIEIILTLRRASLLSTRTFFLLEVQNLKQKVLGDLIAEIGRQKEKEKLGRVAVFCRASDSHTLFTVFPDDVVRVKAITAERLKVLIENVLSSVQFWSSSRPSIGKTDSILQETSEFQSLLQVHISGKVTKDSLIKTLSKKAIGKDCAVHIDVGWVENPDSLELIIFEALFCKSLVSSGGAIVPFNPKIVYIEVANSINNKLEDSFTILSQIGEHRVKWAELDNFIASEEPLSPCQVVCQYFKHLHENTLDSTEVNFHQRLPLNKCRHYLKLLFQDHLTSHVHDQTADLTFSLVGNCLKVMSHQLKKFSFSEYFKIRNLHFVFGSQTSNTVRSKMVKFIFDSTIELTVKSLGSVQKQQVDAHTNVYERTANRFRSMLNWENSAHVMPVFQKQNMSAVELVFRKLEEVPEELKNMFQASSSGGLVEYSDLSEEQLFKRLVRVASSCSPGDYPDVSADIKFNYRLTADNFLKMILISLRIDADVPVLIMGETGCGKTSLIRFLAEIQGTPLNVMNFHAGVTEKQIIDHIESAVKIAVEVYELFVNSEGSDGVVWVFLDEINTCDHLGLLKEIICHKKLLGASLPPNLRFLAACNPYILRSKIESCTAGFETKQLREDAMKSLVYRVHPLPESMVELVWDFGRLTDTDERAYIGRIITVSLSEALSGSCEAELQLEDIIKCVADSQCFVRHEKESDYATSLRDVRRFCEFYNFFLDFFGNWNECQSQNQDFNFNTKRLAFLFSLYICYYVRNASSTLRLKYLKTICKYFETSTEDLSQEIDRVVMGFLACMTLPPRTADNLALRENVFVLFCCIYTRIPVFLVGKPGCSKSLAVSIIRSNFRGKDSENHLFQQYHALSFSSFQGSEASTSEGIQKVFEASRKKLKNSKDSNFVPVVLIDEIGLAEKSRHNPLKVLHSLLEPQSSLDCRCEFAVIGISNWALDPAKMNRAIHISRPDMTQEELYLTGKAISSTVRKSIAVDDEYQKKIAEACHEYLNQKQPFENFHGLRDFYYLVKFLCDQSASSEDSKACALREGITRNFNGLKRSHDAVSKIFEKHFPALLQTTVKTDRHKSIAETMILKNLKDTSARHLMLISDSDCCLYLLCNLLTKEGRKFRVIHGSAYDLDQYSEEFTYRKLNEVIMCIEEGLILIFKDFELLYGSLYDMLNQNYSEYANKKYCRIAMGTQANQNCVVHDAFRCIVLVSKASVQELRHVDPPFLNRFEKQPFSLKDTVEALKLHDASLEVNSKLKLLTNLFYNDCEVCFRKSEIFLGYHDELVLCYLIEEFFALHRAQRNNSPVVDVFKRFIMHMLPESVLRCTFSKLAAPEKEAIQREYYNPSMRSRNRSLVDVIRECVDNCKEGKVSKLIMYTKSSLYTKIDFFETESFMKDHLDFTDVRLMDFVNESGLIETFTEFFKKGSRRGLLIIRVKPSIDGDFILHSRCLLEDMCQNYESECKNSPKIVIFLVHLQREDFESESASWKWNPLLTWEFEMVECISPEVRFSLSDLVLDKQTLFLQDNSDYLSAIFKKTVPQVLHEVHRSPEEITEVLQFLQRNTKFMASLEKFTLHHSLSLMTRKKETKPFDPDHWVISLSMETTELATYSSFHDFVIFAIQKKIKQNLSIIFRALWSYSIFSSHNWDESVSDSLLPRILEYIASEQGSRMESAGINGLLQLRVPYSDVAFSGLFKVFTEYKGNDEKCKLEMQGFLSHLGLDRTIETSDPIVLDFISESTVKFCGQDRSDSLKCILENALSNCIDLTDVALLVFNCFNGKMCQFAELLNVHAYLQHHKINPLILHVDTENLKQAVHSVLLLLVPSFECFEQLKISTFSDWRKIIMAIFSLLRNRQDWPSFLLELELLLNFFELFAPSGRQIDATVVINVFERLKDRDLLKSEVNDSTRLLEWKEESKQLFNEASAPCDDEMVMLIEANFYYTLLQNCKLTEPLLTGMMEMLIRGQLPIGFVSCIWKHITTDDDDENNLFNSFAERLETMADVSKKGDLFSILATNFKPGLQTPSELLESLEILRPKLKSSLEIEFQELVELVDAMQFFLDATMDATVAQSRFLCFGNDQADVLSFLEKCLLTQKLHPFWLLFVRCLRQRYSLGEIFTILKFDHTTSILASINRDNFLQFGQAAQLAPYCLRYPFLDCTNEDLYTKAVQAFSDVLVAGRPDYGNLRQLWKNLNESNIRREYCNTLSIYIENVLFKKCFTSFQSPEKALTREIKDFFLRVLPRELSPLVQIASGETDSCVDEANLTSQLSPGSVCLSTLYYRTIMSFVANWPPQKGSIVDNLSKSGTPVVCESELRTKYELRVQCCACFNVTIFKAGDDELGVYEQDADRYQCAFCGSFEEKKLSSFDASRLLSNEPITDVVKQALLLLISLHRYVWLDVQRGQLQSSIKPTPLLGHLESLAQVLGLCIEDCSWTVHAALATSTDLFFNQPANDGWKAAHFCIAQCIAKPHKAVAKFKRDRINERQLRNQFSYAWIVDGLGSHEEDRDQGFDFATARQYQLAHNRLLFPNRRCDTNAVCQLLDCFRIKKDSGIESSASHVQTLKVGRLLQFVLRNKELLEQGDCLRLLAIWHTLAAKNIDGHLSIEEFQAWRISDFLQKHPDCKAAHEAAMAAWSRIQPDAINGSCENPLEPSKKLQKALFTELSPLMAVAKSQIYRLNEFIVAACGLALNNECEATEILLSLENNYNSSACCLLNSSDFLASPDRLPAMSEERLAHLSATFASHSSSRDLHIDWGLLETAVFREVLLDKCYVRLSAWEPHLASGEQRSLALIINAFRANCPGADTESARISETEQRFVHQRQQQDTSYARRLADFCRVALSFAHRHLDVVASSVVGVDSSLVDFLDAGAANGLLPPKSTWPPLPSGSSGESLSSSSSLLSLLDAMPLRRLVSLLESAEAELFSAMRPDLERLRRSRTEPSMNAMAGRLAELIPQQDQADALRWLRLACVRHSTATIAMTAASVLTEPANRPTGARPDCLAHVLAEIGEAPLTLLLPLYDALEKIADAKKEDRSKYSKLLSRMKRQ